MSDPVGIVVAWMDGGLRIEGELDTNAAPVARRAIADHLAEKPEIRIDTAGITFCDSSGLETLLRPAIDGHQVTIVRPSPPLARLLDIVSADELPELTIET